MNKLVPLQFARFYKRFVTLKTNMNPGPMSVEMLSHGTIVSENLITAGMLANI